MRRMCLVEREEERKRMQKWRVVCLNGWRRRKYAKEKVEGLRTVWSGEERRGNWWIRGTRKSRDGREAEGERGEEKGEK